MIHGAVEAVLMTAGFSLFTYLLVKYGAGA
jgi:hypothetical protein